MANREIEQFRKSFDNIFEQVSHRQLLAKSAWALDSMNEGHEVRADSALPALQEEYAIQLPIRRWFGKQPQVNEGRIGCHPDFVHLEGTDEIEYHHVTTMFIDVKDSTRLGLRYPLEVVQHIKNSILRAASETVRAMDGHVHRFMGDALMAFFGGKDQTKESSAMAAISCAAMLQALMQESVVPALTKRNIDAQDIGFRVGLDFGDDSEVLWSSYGYTAVNEVTATSFFVDVSAKLQSMASKDTAMLGQNLMQYLDFPEALVRCKKEKRGDEMVPVPYLRPNYEKQDGSSLNYVVRKLDFKAFARLLPLPTEFKQIIVPDIKARAGFSFRANVLGDAAGARPYPSLSECLPKNVEVAFTFRAEPHAFDGLRLPLSGKFIKQNHGQEADDEDSLLPEFEEFTMRPVVDAYKNAKVCTRTFKRHTAYRGLHTVTVHVVDAAGQVVFNDTIAVHIR
ncbi:nucleotide-binding domain-containing protein [Paraburkholderia sartisoli]|uniref:Adenylate and Guanylate cyclase catalytic domain-containing protein n=1 Tax=Paraburkholderia sartisoli TaxID=83784 RepID=A0A1H4GQC3_9BURK|nr:adenylate/guanylate cyclase domain-containing protein [Paraburkholderia sartisoli]SEB11805.1 Adenylate and Guanylate cyclase catalytic domain-containing protein [Paraburkholderia sartisoli]